MKPNTSGARRVAGFVVAATSPAAAAVAEGWAARLRVPMVAGPPGAGADLVLEVGPTGLALRTPEGMRVVAALAELVGASRPGRDLLAKAALTGSVGGPPNVVDATAGLGADGFHLAALGHHIVMVEREPLFAALLEDGLARALAGELGPVAAESARRVQLQVADAREYFATAAGTAAVVYLDPMFPEGSKAALPNKGMAALRARLDAGGEAAALEEAELLRAARAFARRRVVVKRPLKAPTLGGQAPSGSLRGSTVRYDLYAPLPG